MTTHLLSLPCVSFGVAFTLSAESDPLLAMMLRCAPLDTQSRIGALESGQPFVIRKIGDDYGLWVGEELVAEGLTLQEVLERLAGDLMVHVANHAPNRVFVHAGVVGWQGRALILPGVSFAGKTTLVAELVRAGATYYSDEYAVLDECGCVHPYACDLQMRRPGEAAQKALGIEHLKGSIGTRPLSVSHVVFTQYVQSGRWDPQPVSAGMAVLEMMRHTIPVQRTPARVMATLAKMMETAIALRSDRGEACKSASNLLAAMTTST